MTSEYQIRDGKLQYDINREAAKISALSSGRIDKYEYLNGGKILPSNQQQITEQAKFTYSPFKKAFEKQTKSIEDQGRKQIDALEALKPKEVKPKETKLVENSNYFLEGLVGIRKNNNPINFYDLTYNCKDSKHAPTNFIRFKGPNSIFKSMHNGDIVLKDVEEEQKELKSDLGYIKQGNPKNRSPE